MITRVWNTFINIRLAMWSSKSWHAFTEMPEWRINTRSTILTSYSRCRCLGARHPRNITHLSCPSTSASTCEISTRLRACGTIFAHVLFAPVYVRFTIDTIITKRALAYVAADLVVTTAAILTRWWAAFINFDGTLWSCITDRALTCKGIKTIFTQTTVKTSPVKDKTRLSNKGTFYMTWQNFSSFAVSFNNQKQTNTYATTNKWANKDKTNKQTT